MRLISVVSVYLNTVTRISTAQDIFILHMSRLELRSGHVGLVVDKVALGQVFSEYIGFPCQFSFHRLLHIHHHHLSSGDGSGRRTKWTQSYPTPLQETLKKLSYTPPSC
jgi:hypothetical protein